MRSKEKSVISIIMQIIFVLSCPFLTLLLSNRYETLFVCIGAFISLIISFILVRKFSHQFSKINNKKLLVALAVSLYMLGLFSKINNLAINSLGAKINDIFGIYLEDGLYKLVALLAIPALTCFIYLFIDKVIPKIKKFILGLSKMEKRYLVIIGIIGFIVAFYANTVTTAFSIPYHEGNLKIYDVLYTTDSGSLVYEDTYFNVSFAENDIRQPLFGVFALPFSVVGINVT